MLFDILQIFHFGKTNQLYSACGWKDIRLPLWKEKLIQYTSCYIVLLWNQNGILSRTFKKKAAKNLKKMAKVAFRQHQFIIFCIFKWFFTLLIQNWEITQLLMFMHKPNMIESICIAPILDFIFEFKWPRVCSWRHLRARRFCSGAKQALLRLSR